MRSTGQSEADPPPAGLQGRPAAHAPKHLDFVDALRGVAILLVIVFHTTLCVDGLPTIVMEALGRGSSGVQLFYVLSAFTLCASFRARDGERSPLARYALRRVFRIVPMFWVAIVLFMWINRHFPHFGPPHDPPVKETILAALLLHGFSPAALNGIVPAGWSVAIESQFYVLLPLVFWVASSLRRTLVLLAASLVVSAVSIPVLEHLMLPYYPASDRWLIHEFAYYSLPSQGPVFLLGVLAYRLLGPDRAALARLEAAVPLRAIAIVLATLILLPLRHSFPGHLGFGLMGFCLVMICAGVPTPLLDNRVTRFFGKISYSAYLLHFAITFLLEAKVEPLLVASPAVRLVVMEIAVLALVAVAASITHALVEEPGMALGRRVSRRLTQVPAGAPGVARTA